MTIAIKQEPIILLVGDVVFFLLALWVTLLVRYVETPSATLLYNHIIPFSLLFIVWVLVFFISGLYNKHTSILRKKIPSIILNAQAINIIIAALFFFFVPYFDIAPKTNLVLYLVFSSLFIIMWRINFFPYIGFRKKQKAVIIGYQTEVDELTTEVNGNPRYALEFVDAILLDGPEGVSEVIARIKEKIHSGEVSVIVADIKSRSIESVLNSLSSITEKDVTYLDIHNLYEDIFERIPLSALNERWIMNTISTRPRIFYALAKRAIDILGSVTLGLLSLLVYPFVYLLIKLEDGGSVFITQTRIGEDGEEIVVVKFRTMTRNEDGVWIGETDNTITRVGSFLRKTRIDELPQLWSVFIGDMSFIGPRPDIAGLHKRLSEEIPHYTVRNFIKPGLTGWAQIKQDYGLKNQVSPQSVVDTEVRLAYDVYYIKNRSLILDIQIALQTLTTIFSRLGS